MAQHKGNPTLNRFQSKDKLSSHELDIQDCQTFAQVISLLAHHALRLQWSEVFEISHFFLPHFSHNRQETLQILSFYIRADAFVHGRISQEENYENFKNFAKNYLTRETQSADSALIINVRLTVAALARLKGQYARSWFHCKKAAALCGFKSPLKAEADFGIALSLSNLKRNYEALSYYEKVQRNSFATPERKQLARINEAYLRLQMSDLQTVQEILPEIPLERGLRIELMMDFLKQGSLSPKHFQALESSQIPFSEKTRLWVYLLESLLIQRPYQESNFEMNALIDFLVRAKESTQDSLIEAALRMLSSPLPPKDFQPIFKNTQDEADFLYLKILFHAAQGCDVSEQYLQLDEFLKVHKIHDPFIPRLSVLQHPQFSLHAKLASLILTKHKNQPQIILCENTRSLIWGEDSWSLAKNPKTWTLVSALAEAKSSINKQQIHQTLTGNKYVERLHDPRVWMLIKRFRSNMMERWAIDPVELPGDNQIHLRVRFMRKS